MRARVHARRQPRGKKVSSYGNRMHAREEGANLRRDVVADSDPPL